MWKIKTLKKNARGVLKRNYFSIIVACVLVTLVMGTFINPVSTIENARDSFLADLNGTLLFDDSGSDAVMADGAKTEHTSNTEIVDSFLGGVGMDNEGAKRWTRGVLSVFASNTEGAGSFLYGVLNSLNQIVFNDKIGAGVIIAIGSLIYLLITIFFVRVILAGFYRYLLENRAYKKTRLARILFPWSVRRGRNTAWVMFVRRIYSLLWSLTIAGGIIKRYSYRLVPMIIAENPDIGANDAITLSRRMMDGNKRRAFCA